MRTEMSVEEMETVKPWEKIILFYIYTQRKSKEFFLLYAIIINTAK